jgi:Fe-S cluster assembly protein SufD
VTEIVLGPGAKVEHTRITEGAAESLHIGTLSVSQARESGYASRVVTIGGALSRLDLDVVLDGEGADCLLDGVYHVTGREHVDCYTRIDHARPYCTSNERYRGVVDGKGHAVFDGTIIVRKQSQRTDAHQENRNLLLSDDATVHTKPHLRIDADDVKCSHGATIGALDEDSLFYLRARGIPEARARTILTYAFVRELVDPIPQPALRRRAGELLLARLNDGQAIREIL